MKVVITSDTHHQGFEQLVPDGDVLIHCGDFMEDGDESEWEFRLHSFDSLKHPIKILIGGNHDVYLERNKKKAIKDLKSVGVSVIGWPSEYPSCVLPNGMTLLGLPFVIDLPFFAFEVEPHSLKQYLDQFNHFDIVVSHCPPYGVLDNRWGIDVYNEFYKRTKPSYWFTGHVHSESGKSVTLDETTFYNVAMCNEKNRMVNSPLVLEL